MQGTRIAKQIQRSGEGTYSILMSLLKRVKWKNVVFPLLLIGLVLGVTLSEEVGFKPKSAVYVFDVGQGDGMLVKSKEGVTILIDGGPTGKIVEYLDAALSYRDREIDYVITTHPHADHVAGLVNVLERFPVKNVVMTGVVHTTDVYLEFLNVVMERKCKQTSNSNNIVPVRVNPVFEAGSGGVIFCSVTPRAKNLCASSDRASLRKSLIPSPLSPVDVRVSSDRVRSRKLHLPSPFAVSTVSAAQEQDSCLNIVVANSKKIIQDKDVTIELLWPQESFEGKTVRDAGEDTEGGLNDTSVVSRITLDGAVFLFPGDAGAGVERKLLEQKENVDADVLVLAHHGSKTASSEEFLKAVSPKFAGISVGVKNRYGLPAYLIVRRVERLGIPIYRTDQDGTLEFLVEGGAISVKTER